MRSAKPEARGNGRRLATQRDHVGCGERTRIDTDRNFPDVRDRMHEITAENVDTTHVFTLSQVDGGRLLKMGERNNDGGQFFTPREVIRVMVRAIDPRVDFFRLLPTRGDSERSWTVDRKDVEARSYDLKAVNPNAKRDEDLRSPEELLDVIEAKGREVAGAITNLRRMLR